MGRKRTREGSEGQLKFYWNKDYYKQFTFMLDATVFDDKPKHVKDQQSCIKLKNKEFPPEEQKAPPSLKQATSVMAYTVIHPHLGIILGPEFMYTGSSRTSRVGDEERVRHHRSFPHWYAPIVV